MATILIVDDELMNRELLRAYLTRENHALHDAASGAEALELVREHRPDLILLDVLMPGLDGYEVTRRLRAEITDTFLPIVLVSALVDREARRRGLDAGADDFLAKPVDSVELRARVGTMLMLRKQALELRARAEELDTLHQLLARVREEVQAEDGSAEARLATLRALLTASRS